MIQQKNIVIIDYGLGNLFSLQKAFEHLGLAVKISEEPEDLLKAEALILPGVGAYPAGMRGITIRGLNSPIKKAVAMNKPVLGICLGMQLLSTIGLEFERCAGLDLIAGEVVQLSGLHPGTKIPHIGWNNLYQPELCKTWDQTILEKIPVENHVYFVHSFIFQPRNAEHVLAETMYGGQKVCAAVKKGNLYGCQFHPEKSGEIGLQILKNFIKLIN